MGEITSFRLRAPSTPEIAARFQDIHPPLESQAATIEANRCLYCFDAPCTAACPTHIDVPRFIKKIASGNLEGSARTILDANILGASCARVCPVDVLCEGSCVMHGLDRQPIQIARLQRFAMDSLHAKSNSLPFEPGPDTGRSVALIGAGPASLACAAELRRHGIRAIIYDARPLPGGLNTYGVAEYKLPLTDSLREIDMLQHLGVEFRFEKTVDADLLTKFEQGYDAIFLGIGLGAIHCLGIPGEELAGVTNALDYIAGYKSGEIFSAPPRVAVVGAGNTAIDAAIASVRLGASEVHILYRRGPENMSAFTFEYDHAKQEGVRFHWHVRPLAIEGNNSVQSIRLLRLKPATDASPISQSATEFALSVDLVVTAIGQGTQSGSFANWESGEIALERGRILIDRETGQTSNPKFFAGGDCTNGGREVVDAVADGKRAGRGIAAWLETQHAHL